MITEKEIKEFWNFWDQIMIRWFLVSFFGFPFIPIALILKYAFGVKGLWLLNDTKDGDFGDPEVLKEYGHQDKSKFFKFWWWWFRNHSWNFIVRFNPEWEGGRAEEFRTIKTTLYTEETPEEEVKKLRWTWCTKKGVHGFHYVAFRINGKVYCRWSKANHRREKLMGAGGDRYKLKLR